MPSIRKPVSPTLSPAEIRRHLDPMGELIKSHTGADGAVDVVALENAVKATGDGMLKSQLETIKRSFPATEERVSTGCGGERRVSSHSVDPKKLEAGQVQRVMTALTEAKAAVAKLDDDQDGFITNAETEQPGHYQKLVGALVKTAVDASFGPFKAELEKWKSAVREVASNLNARTSLEQTLTKGASRHAATPLGAEAIAWAYRDLATTGRGEGVWNMDDKLKRAETSFVRHLPLFSKSVLGEGHLNDAEIKRMLGTQDLAGFAAAKKTAVDAKVGGDYLGHYLLGKDLPGVEHLKDPDAAIRPSC